MPESELAPQRSVPLWRRLAVAVPALPLAALFGFFGWYKAFASTADLAMHHAWTAHLPWWIGRPQGWAEMAGAIALAASITPRAWRATRIAAAWLAVSQIVACFVHVHEQESASLGQNLVLFLLFGLIAVMATPPKPLT
jgi:hypothetical protein